MQRDKVTAPYLAEKFEVSRRTINRDIEAICKAGIPVVTLQGVNGGIAIAEGYKIDKTIFTPEELGAIITGLKGLSSISKASSYTQLMEKLVGDKEGVYRVKDNLLIDLSSFYKDSLSYKIETLKRAIEAKQLVELDYFYSKGEVKRKIEPYLLLFKWSSWYLYGYCQEKQDFRMFKLNRMGEIRIREEQFELRDLPQIEEQLENYFEENIFLVAQFEESVQYRVIDEYGLNSFVKQKDGALLFERYFTNRQYLLSWLLSFGDQVEVIEPEEMRQEIKRQAEGMQKKYL